MAKSSYCFILCFLLLRFISEAQEQSRIKDPLIGIHFIMNDFKTADYMRNHSLSEAIGNHEFAKVENLKSGLAISYSQGLSPHIDFSASLSGSYLDYRLHDGTLLGNGKLLLETEASIFGKLFTDDHFISPFLSVGLGASKYDDYYGLIIPLGLGLQLNFSNEVYLLMNAQYRIGMTNKVNDHFYYSFGIAGNIWRKKRIQSHSGKSVPVGQVVYDRDKDGIADSLDACPDTPGFVVLNGCPDRDGDGIPDHEDKCPAIPGVIKYHGCPIPDTDGDGINDEQDSCSTIPGVMAYHGCPVPDSDKEGVNDKKDKCPLVPGLVSNSGCPPIDETVKKQIALDARKIFFKTGSYELLPRSFAPLNNVARVLKAHPSLHLFIEGHTDNVGTAQKNQLLSENRAKAVMDYLLKNGIGGGRLSIKGYGFSKPIATNRTNEGRALNRRVELSLFSD